MKNAVLMIVMAMALTSVRAGDCYWTGGGDGVNWSDDANWDVPPTSGYGDTLWFTNSVSTCNDVENFRPRTINFRGEGPVVVSGLQIEFTSGGTGIDSWCLVEMNAPIRMSNHDITFMHLKRFDYNGLITVEGARTLILATPNTVPPASSTAGDMPDVRINGGVSAPDGTLSFQLGRNSDGTLRPFWVNSALDVKTLNWQGACRNQVGYLTAGGQNWQKAYVRFGTCRATAENVYSPTAVLSWAGYLCTVSGGWDLNGYDQVIDRVYSESFPTNSKGVLQVGDCLLSAQPATLTMNATGNGRCWAEVQGKLSLAWAPCDGNLTMEFFNRDYTTSGDLFVSNGTMSVLGTATFRNVGEIRVGDGATFDLATTAANALAGTKNLLVEGAGVFRVAATAATPFSSVRVRMDADAKLAVPEGVTLTVGALSVGGIAQADATYTGETWIDGAGSVKVDSTTLAAASWKAPVSGDWSEAAKWQGGAVPNATMAVKIDAAGADYTVTAADGTAHNAAISIGGGAVDGTVTLKPAGTFTQTGETLAVGRGGRIELGEDADYSFVSDTSWRDPTVTCDISGEMAIDGGSFTADPFYGRMTVGGKVSVKNGFLTVNPWQSGNGSETMQSLRVPWDGRIEIGDGATFFPVAYGWGATPISMEGGTIAVSGTGVWSTRHPSSQNDVNAKYEGYGRVTFADDASLTNGSKTVYVHSKDAYYPFEWTVSDRARLDFSTGALNLQGGAWNTLVGATTVLTLDSSARQTLGDTCVIGANKGCGILNIRRGTVEVGSYKLGVGVMTDQANQASFAPTGTVNMTGGALTVDGANVGGSTMSRILGMDIGSTLPVNGGTIKPAGAGGTFNLSGGVVTSIKGHVVFGAGLGRGVMNQTGGTFVGLYNTRGGTSYEGNLVALGFMNGTGLWTMTGGTTVLSPSVYVGGCDTNRLHMPNLNLTLHTEDSLAKGRLSVQNATFSTERSLVLGERGTGALEIGPGGTVSAGSFAVSNAASTVTIKLGADGSGNLAIAGDLAVEAGAKLVIDASKVNPENVVRGVNVVTWGTASRPYADANVTFIGDAKGVLQFKKTAKGYRIPGTNGMMLIFR